MEDDYMFYTTDDRSEEDLQREDSGDYYDYNFLTDILTEEDLQREDYGDYYDLIEEDPSLAGQIGDLFKKFGKSGLDALKSIYKKPASEGGGTDWRAVAATAGGILGMTGLGSLTQAQTQPSGYQGGIPSYRAVRERVQDTYDPTRRAGSGGMRYFSDINYVAPDALEATRTAAQEQAAGLAALNLENPANQRVVPLNMPQTQPATTQTTANRPASSVIEDLPVPVYNKGGVASLKQGRYLGGPTDGMADELSTTIDNKQPAALSHGEFVVPADVVSHLGNGNSTAGADKLYEMMDKIRHARTGNKKQGKEINPNKFLPT